MNKTGLAESLFPLSTSSLFCSVVNDNEWKRFLVPGIPAKYDFFQNTQLPIIFDFNPLKCPCEQLKIPENQETYKNQNKNKSKSPYYLPKCSRCLAYPSKLTYCHKNQWICAICGQKNLLQSNYFVPALESFDLIYEDSSLQPLFLFVIQPTPFFTNPQLLSQVGDVLDVWAHQNDYKVALISLGQISISFDLKKSKSYVFIDEFPYLLPCNSREAHFKVCLKSLKTYPSHDFLFLLKNLFSSFLSTKANYFHPNPNLNTNSNSNIRSNTNSNSNIRSNFQNQNRQNRKSKLSKQFIYATIFANDIINSSEFALEEDNEDEIIMQLFRTPNFLCENFANICQRINIIGEYTQNTLAPRLSTMLQSGSLFDTVIRLYTPPFLKCDLSFYNGLFEDAFCQSPYLDGQSSACFQMHLKSLPNNPQTYIQLCLSGLLGNGKRLYRIINIQLQSLGSIDSIDGPLYGVFLGRKIAVHLLTHSENSSFLNHHQDCINLISEWSESGNYHRSILEIVRDIPVFMFSLEQYSFFSNNATKIEKIASQKDFLRMCCSILQRELYPSLIIPPFNFPNRLIKDNIIGKKLAIFLGGCEGIALVFEEGHDEDIEKISKHYQIPLTVFKDGNYDNANNFLVEEQGLTFNSYAQKVEVEVNGRRF